MKKILAGFVVLFSAVCLIAFAGIIEASGPQLLFDASQVDLSKESKVKIKGTGFKPEQKVKIIFFDVNGVASDINYALKPEPIANNKGGWETTWNAKRYIGKKLLKAGEHRFTVMDIEYNVLASGSLKFVGKASK